MNELIHHAPSCRGVLEIRNKLPNDERNVFCICSLAMHTDWDHFSFRTGLRRQCRGWSSTPATACRKQGVLDVFLFASNRVLGVVAPTIRWVLSDSSVLLNFLRMMCVSPRQVSETASPQAYTGLTQPTQEITSTNTSIIHCAEFALSEANPSLPSSLSCYQGPHTADELSSRECVSRPCGSSTGKQLDQSSQVHHHHWRSVPVADMSHVRSSRFMWLEQGQLSLHWCREGREKIFLSRRERDVFVLWITVAASQKDILSAWWNFCFQETVLQNYLNLGN